MAPKPESTTHERPIAVCVELNERQHVLKLIDGETIFAAAHRAGLCPPFSCVAGVCGECVATLEAGEVAMKSNRALSARQLDRGLILTCQATPLGEGCRLRFGDHPRLE
jgi:ferredoxin